MSYYSPSIEKLIESFEKLPSIGHKTATRLAFHMLNLNEESTKEFINSIIEAKKNLRYCSKCFNITETDPCPICSSPKRDQSTICVVEDVKDVVAMEKTHEFKGVYHVLHGSISPMNGIGPEDIKIKELNVVVGETFYNSIKDKKDLKIAFELQKDVTEGINSATNSVIDDMVKVRDGTGSPWNYIKLKTNKFKVSLPTSYPADGRIYDISTDTINNPDGNNTFSFYWGSYFDEEAPSEFYKAHEPKEGLRGYYQNALKELQAMKKALTGKLKLTATFDYGQTTVGK